MDADKLAISTIFKNSINTFSRFIFISISKNNNIYNVVIKLYDFFKKKSLQPQVFMCKYVAKLIALQYILNI